jgi:hypothetical protein
MWTIPPQHGQRSSGVRRRGSHTTYAARPARRRAGERTAARGRAGQFPAWIAASAVRRAQEPRRKSGLRASRRWIRWLRWTMRRARFIRRFWSRRKERSRPSARLGRRGWRTRPAVKPGYGSGRPLYSRARGGRRRKRRAMRACGRRIAGLEGLPDLTGSAGQGTGAESIAIHRAVAIRRASQARLSMGGVNLA